MTVKVLDRVRSIRCWAMRFAARSAASLLSAALCLSLCAPVAASDLRSVAPVRIPLEDWTLVPTLEGSMVQSFVAFRLDGGLSGNNISLVWFQRANESRWHAYAWSGAAPEGQSRM